MKKAEPAKEAAVSPAKQEEQAAVPVASEQTAESPVQA